MFRVPSRVKTTPAQSASAARPYNHACSLTRLNLQNLAKHLLALLGIGRRGARHIKSVWRCVRPSAALVFLTLVATFHCRGFSESSAAIATAAADATRSVVHPGLGLRVGHHGLWLHIGEHGIRDCAKQLGLSRGRLRRVRQMLQRTMARHLVWVLRRVVRREHAAGGPLYHSEPSRRHAAHVHGHQQRDAWRDRDGDAVRNLLLPDAFGDAVVVLDQRLRI